MYAAALTRSVSLVCVLRSVGPETVHPLLVLGGARRHAGCAQLPCLPELLGPQRAPGAGGVEEGRHLPEPGIRRPTPAATRRLPAHPQRGALQTQQARRGLLPVRGHHRQPGHHHQQGCTPHSRR